jgi:hypothetical protein
MKLVQAFMDALKAFKHVVISFSSVSLALQCLLNHILNIFVSKVFALKEEIDCHAY